MRKIVFCFVFLASTSVLAQEKPTSNDGLAFACDQSSSEAYKARKYKKAADIARRCYLEHQRPRVAHRWLEASHDAGLDLSEPCRALKDQRSKLSPLKREQVGGWCDGAKGAASPKKAEEGDVINGENREGDIVLGNKNEGDRVEGDKIDHSTINIYQDAKKPTSPIQRVFRTVGFGLLGVSLVSTGLGLWRYTVAGDLREQGLQLDATNPNAPARYTALRREFDDSYGQAVGLGAVSLAALVIGAPMVYFTWD